MSSSDEGVRPRLQVTFTRASRLHFRHASNGRFSGRPLSPCSTARGSRQSRIFPSPRSPRNRPASRKAISSPSRCSSATAATRTRRKPKSTSSCRSKGCSRRSPASTARRSTPQRRRCTDHGPAGRRRTRHFTFQVIVPRDAGGRVLTPISASAICISARSSTAARRLRSIRGRAPTASRSAAFASRRPVSPCSRCWRSCRCSPCSSDRARARWRRSSHS